MNIEQQFNGLLYETCWTLQPGEQKTFRFASAADASLFVHATGAGVSALVEMTGSPLAELDAGTERYVTAAIGAAGVVSNASAKTEIPARLNGVRVTATGGPVVVEILQ